MAGKRVVVCGYGDVGKGTAASFKGAGSIVTVTEIIFVPCKPPWMVLKWSVWETVVGKADIVITTTGNKDICVANTLKPWKTRPSCVTLDTSTTRLTWPGWSEIHGSTKVEIKPQVDKYTVNGNDIIPIGRRAFGKFRLCYGAPQFCDEQLFYQPNLGADRAVEQQRRLRKQGVHPSKTFGRKVAKLHLEKLVWELASCAPTKPGTSE